MSQKSEQDRYPFPRRDVYLINRRVGRRLLWMFAIMPAIATIGKYPGTLVYSVLTQNMEDSVRAIKPKMDIFEVLEEENLLWRSLLFSDAGSDIFGPFYQALAACRHENRTYTLKVIRQMHDENLLPTADFAKWYNLLSAPLSGFIASHTLPFEKDWVPYVGGYSNKKLFIQAPTMQLPDRALTNTEGMEKLFENMIHSACTHLGVSRSDISLKRTILRLDQPGGAQSVAAVSLFLLSREAPPHLTTLYVLHQPAYHDDLLRIAALYPEIEIGVGAPDVQKTDVRRSENAGNPFETSSREGSSSGGVVGSVAGTSSSRPPQPSPLARGPNPPPGHAFASSTREPQTGPAGSASHASRSPPRTLTADASGSASSSRQLQTQPPASAIQRSEAQASTSSSSSSSSSSSASAPAASSSAPAVSSARRAQVQTPAIDKGPQRQPPTPNKSSPTSSKGRKARTRSTTRQDTPTIGPQPRTTLPKPQNIPRRPGQTLPKSQTEPSGASGASSAPKPTCTSLTDLAEMMMAMSPPSRPSSSSAPASRTQSSSSKKSTGSVPPPSRRALLTRAQHSDVSSSRGPHGDIASRNPLSGSAPVVEYYSYRTPAPPKSSREVAGPALRLGVGNSGSESSLRGSLVSTSSSSSSATTTSGSSAGTFAFPTPPIENVSPRPMPGKDLD